MYKSPLRYPGGKAKAIKYIAPLLPAKCHEYREPFVGGGSVFFHARSVNMAEQYWINDLFGDLMCFYWTVRDPMHNEHLRNRLLEWQKRPVHEIEAEFYRIKDIPFASDSANAFKFFFLNRVTFSGTTQAGGFSRSAAKDRFTESSIDRLKPMVEALESVYVTNAHAFDVINMEGPDAFLFLDPPYYTAERLYGKNGELHEFDHKAMAEMLSATKHRFLLTYDDCPEIRDLYDGFDIIPWNLQYGMNNCCKSKESKKGNELFIKNY